MNGTETSPLDIRHVLYESAKGTVHVHIMEMLDSAMIWVNNNEISMKNLAVATATRYSDIPSSASLLGSELQSQGFASKLARKTGKQIFVSWNLPSANATEDADIERRVIQEIMK